DGARGAVGPWGRLGLDDVGGRGLGRSRGVFASGRELLAQSGDLGMQGANLGLEGFHLRLQSLALGTGHSGVCLHARYTMTRPVSRPSYHERLRLPKGHPWRALFSPEDQYLLGDKRLPSIVLGLMRKVYHTEGAGPARPWYTVASARHWTFLLRTLQDHRM